MSARSFRAIRRRLGVSMAQIGAGMGCTAANVYFYERGQNIPPHAASNLIAYCAKHGLYIDFNHVYGDAPLPEVVKPTPTEA